MKKEIAFEDGSVLDVNERWIKCTEMKYGISFDKYWSNMSRNINELWKEGKVLTKFGKEDLKRRYQEKEITRCNRAEHAAQCIYVDLRACLMSLALQSLSEKGLNAPKIIGIAEDEIHIYDGKKMKFFKEQ